MTARCCIAFTTDTNYLFPTLVSAVGARRHSSPAKADVLIFCFGLDGAADHAFRPVCEANGVRLVALSPRLVADGTAMMARLFLDRFVPPEYDQLLYMDGDLLIEDSLDPLVDAELEPGTFLAANDPFSFLLEDNNPLSREMRRHIEGLGLRGAAAATYFNSGVLRMHREGWDAIGQRAWKAFRERDLTRFPDQDAINLVAHEQRRPMSLRWNYPIFLRNARLAPRLQPVVLHFMSSPKPWQGNFAPWGESHCEPYRAIVDQYPQLSPYWHSMRLGERLKYSAQQRYKQVTETLSWGFGKRRERILAYEQACAAAGLRPAGAAAPAGERWADANLSLP